VRASGPVAAIAACAALLAPLVAGMPARAEVPQQMVEVELLAQPVWHRPGSELGLRLRLTNLGGLALDGFNLQLQAFQRVTTRSALQQTFTGSPGVLFAAYTKAYPERTLAPGESIELTVDDVLAERLSSFADAPEGVYPLTIQVYDPASTSPSGELTTHLLLYPSRPKVPLGFVLVVPLNLVPSRGPDGVFAPPAGSPPNTPIPLEAALAEDGYLNGMLDALERAVAQGLHLGLAPVGRLVDELADMADGYRRVDGDGVEAVTRNAPAARAAAEALDRLAGLLSTEGVQPLLTPYSFADLPTLVRRSGLFGFERLQQQMQAGATVLTDELGADLTSPWVYPPAGRLDAPSLAALRRTLVGGTASKTFFSPESLGYDDPATLTGCPDVIALSFTCPVSVSTLEGGSQGLLSDPGLSERFLALQRADGGRLELQRLLAESAFIHAERPGTGQRVVQTTLPASWQPAPKDAALLLRALARAPWLRTLSPKEALSQSVAPAAERLVEEARPLANEPDDSYFATIAEAESLVNSFATIDPPAAMIDRLRRNLLVVWSRSWWSNDLEDAGESYARATSEEIEREFAKLEIGGAPEITMTSRRSPIAVVIFNDTTYPVRLDLRFDSTKLAVEHNSTSAVYAVGTNPREFPAVAQASGAFPLLVTLQTPDGHVIATKRIIIRSTEFNRIAVGLTLGAFTFITLFYATRALRRRRAAADGGGPGAG
jgi:hypothetical protein